MGFLIDTNVLVDLERGRRSAEFLWSQLADHELGISAITASELLHGVYRAGSSKMAEKRLSFLGSVFSTLSVVPFDLLAARVHARIWADRQRQGLGIGSHDLIIAATALALEWGVVTMNIRDFDKIPGLHLYDPR